MSLKKSLRNLLDKMSRIQGQATLEYLILLAIFVSVATLGANSFLSKVTETGNLFFTRAATSIIKTTSALEELIQSLVNDALNHSNWRVRFNAELELDRVLKSLPKDWLEAHPSAKEAYAQYDAERKNLFSSIMKEFKVSLYEEDGFFTIQELKALQSALRLFPPAFISGLKIKKQALYELAGWGSGKEVDFSSIHLTDLNDYYFLVIVHELGHTVDARQFGSEAFKNLYTRSISPEDFASEYGNAPSEYARKNEREDFATTVAIFFKYPKEDFVRAVQQAKEGKPVLLEKLLFVANVFTEGHSNYTTIAKVVNGQFVPMSLAVTKDKNGNINSIGGVSISDLERLENLFKNLNF